MNAYDFVITSGGIGPTHDGACLHLTAQLRVDGFVDITYASLAKAFNQPLEKHAETLSRMSIMIRNRADILNQTAEQREARERMALFPSKAEALFIAPDVWVVSDILQSSVLSFIMTTAACSRWCASKGNYASSLASLGSSRRC